MFEFKHEIYSVGSARRVASFGVKILKLSLLLSEKIRFQLLARPRILCLNCAQTRFAFMPLNKIHVWLKNSMLYQHARFCVISLTNDCAIRVLIFFVFPGLLVHFSLLLSEICTMCSRHGDAFQDLIL